MPKTVEVLTCSECKFEGYCWRDKPYNEEDPRDDIYEEDIPNYFCASARPKWVVGRLQFRAYVKSDRENKRQWRERQGIVEDAAEQATRLMKEEVMKR